MKLRFNLNYHTAFGEELILNIVSDGKPENATMQEMSTHDGETWTCMAEREAGDEIEYFYSVRCGETTVRTEWLVVPHRLRLSVSGAQTYNIYDRWADIPEDSYLYSSALTDCTAGRTTDRQPDMRSKAAVIMKVRAPQLRCGERLFMAGSDNILGGWSTERALPMTETANNEWTAMIDARALASPRLEYKFLAIAQDGKALWEQGDNRFYSLPRLSDGESDVYELPEARFPIAGWKGAGTVVPVFSLRSEGSFGVGDFGDLMLMTDWAAATGQRAIQLLPVNDSTITHTWTDSYPYKCISIYALHPQYCDLRQLPQLKNEEKLRHYAALQKELNALPQIDYERVNGAKLEFLHDIYSQEAHNITRRKTYKNFVERNSEWLMPYAAFCTYRDLYGTATFSDWPEHRNFSPQDAEELADPKSPLHKEAHFWVFVQYILDSQLRRAHEHAREKHIILKGDIPIGVSRDGVEAWMEPRYFNMNGQAGAPPDAFSVNGQNWGFPTYNWDAMLSDGCAWWVRRFRKMAEYFDAYRIDHVLGFFRIWEIPSDAVHGLLGQFSPAIGLSREEIRAGGLNFQEERFTTPFITDWVLDRIFKNDAALIKEQFLDRIDDERYRMKQEFDTQRKVEKFFESEKQKAKNQETTTLPAKLLTDSVRDGIYALISDVLFLRDKKSPDLFHPRVSAQNDFIYESLWDCDKQAFNRLYDHYFYHRNNDFWYSEAMKKLELLTQSTRMLVCAEDLGMVPDCVPEAMNRLRILTLEIQTMPKDPSVRFGILSHNPYRSVCTFSTHDMPTLRQWWDEDEGQTQEFYTTRLHRNDRAPHPLPGKLAQDVVMRHLKCPSMLCLLSLQDWLSTDEQLRLADKNAERINIPANPRHYWRYRMHLTIEQLMQAADFNRTISGMIKDSGR